MNVKLLPPARLEDAQVFTDKEFLDRFPDWDHFYQVFSSRGYELEIGKHDNEGNRVILARYLDGELV